LEVLLFGFGLWLGIEIIFIPPGEARRNGVIEAINHLWSKSYFSRRSFKSVKDVRRKQSAFLTCYEERYLPPSLSQERVSTVRKKVRRKKLTKKAVKSLPNSLPLTRGRIHFIRRVSFEGLVKVMGESFKVSKRLCAKYV
jgi:hypothetical protein